MNASEPVRALWRRVRLAPDAWRSRSEPTFGGLGSYAPAASHIDDPRYQHWLTETHETNAYHRKVWEWCFLLEAMHAGGVMVPGKSAIGFGVGNEPVPAVLAKHGVEVLATDQPAHGAEAWDETNQHAADSDALRNDGICDPSEFQRLVRFRPVDMRELPRDLGRFDAVWSSCCFEHLGSPQAGFDFVLNSMELLRPGGIGIHTTEYDTNLSDSILEVGDPYTAFYRRRDLEALVLRLRKDGHAVSCNFHLSDRAPEDRFVDTQPYQHHPHLRVQVADAVTTSFGLTIRKAG